MTRAQTAANALADRIEELAIHATFVQVSFPALSSVLFAASSVSRRLKMGMPQLERWVMPLPQQPGRGEQGTRYTPLQHSATVDSAGLHQHRKR